MKKDQTNLSQKEFVILALLIGSGELNGAQLVEQSDGELKKGTVYVTLQRMADKDLIESREEPRKFPEVGIPRRVYCATGVGERLFNAHRRAQESFNIAWSQ